MEKIVNRKFEGERSLFFGRDLIIENTTFGFGESPLKHSENIRLEGSVFEWKYPLWYSKGIKLRRCTLRETARAGVWYTEDALFEDCLIEAPKTFRRAQDLRLSDVRLSHAEETLWACKRVKANDLEVIGNYFGMNSEDVEIDGLRLTGNYAFDGAKNVVIRHAEMLTKDAFWNCENVTVCDSHISGEYFGWNSRNVTLIRCTVESLQGFCYIENLVLRDCALPNTTLAFEYSTVDAEVNGHIESILNPAGGRICADSVGELTLDPDRIDPNRTVVLLGKERT